MKRLILAFLSMVLIFSSCAVGSASMTTTVDNYETGLAQLHAYLSQQSEQDKDTLARIIQTFQGALGHAEANGFLFYAMALEQIENGSFDVADLYIGLIQDNQGLNALLADRDFIRQYGAIHPVSELAAYAKGRRAQAAGDFSAATAAYRECQNFFDGAARLVDMVLLGATAQATVVPAPAVSAAPVQNTVTPTLPPTDAPAPVADPTARPVTYSSDNLLTDSEKERVSSNGFLGIDCRDALKDYVGQTITISFDLRSDRDCTIWVYAYQDSGVSIANPSTAPLMLGVNVWMYYQRFAFTATVKDYGIQLDKKGQLLTGGKIALYDPATEEKAEFTIRRIKIELGTEATNWSPHPQEMPTPTPAPTPAPTAAPTAVPSSATAAPAAPTATPAPAPSATPLPSITLTGNSSNEVNVLEWNAVPGATGYTLKRRLGNQAETQVYSGSNTSYTDGNVMGNYTYVYVVTAQLPGGAKVTSDEWHQLTAASSWQSPTAAPTRAPTPKPTAKPTATPAPTPKPDFYYTLNDGHTHDRWCNENFCMLCGGTAADGVVFNEVIHGSGHLGGHDQYKHWYVCDYDGEIMFEEEHDYFCGESSDVCISCHASTSEGAVIQNVIHLYGDVLTDENGNRYQECSSCGLRDYW